MGPGASLKANSPWCVATENESATLGLKEGVKKYTEDLTGPSSLEAGRKDIMTINKNDRREVRRFRKAEPGCKAHGIDMNDVPTKSFLVCQSGNSLLTRQKAQDYITVKIKEAT